VERLRSNSRVLRQALAEEGFPVAELEMQIVPLVVGEEREAMSLCQKALEGGVFAQGIRPPTVPAGTSRLRLTAMASHTPAELRSAARVFGEAARALGLEPADMGPPIVESVQSPTAPMPAEPSMSEARGVMAAAERVSAGAPFDGELEGGAREEQPPAGGSLGPEGAEAPFDFERDHAAARAA
jgi:hypothetical protein